MRCLQEQRGRGCQRLFHYVILFQYIGSRWWYESDEKRSRGAGQSRHRRVFIVRGALLEHSFYLGLGPGAELVVLGQRGVPSGAFDGGVAVEFGGFLDGLSHPPKREDVGAWADRSWDCHRHRDTGTLCDWARHRRGDDLRWWGVFDCRARDEPQRPKGLLRGLSPAG